MPWLPLYADAHDFRTILDWLNATEELAFIVADGPHRWRAVHTIPSLESYRFCLWHVPSGPLPLLQAHPNRENGRVEDPWSGWQELRTGADASQPYFGAGHPGILWLNHRPVSLRFPRGIGLSGYEWIGNHYRAIGSPADASTEAFWRAMRRWTQKHARKIPRHGPLDGPRPEIYAFPSALAAIESGTDRDMNP